MIKLKAISSFCFTLIVLFCSYKPALGENSNFPVYTGDFDRVQESITPQFGESTLLAAEYFLKNKRFTAAIELLEKQVKECPQEADYRCALCDAHIKFGDDCAKRNEKDAAIEHYRKALEIDRTNSEASEKLKKTAN